MAYETQKETLRTDGGNTWEKGKATGNKENEI